jgi:ABC-type transport system involved in multi-copper enzyme maturation permease subunit
MLALVSFAVLVHGLGLPEARVDNSSDQLTLVLGWGERLGALFAALLGAMAITAEIRHGTIRPTFLVSPLRYRVVAAKVLASTLIGAAYGLAACLLAAGIGTAVLRTRGYDVRLDAEDYLLFLVGGTVGVALWAAIGVGVGALVRNQVPALVGLCAWLLFVEGLLLGDVADIDAVGRFAPGAAAAALSGQDPDRLLAPAIGVIVLAVYAVVTAAAGSLVTSRRDVD